MTAGRLTKKMSLQSTSDGTTWADVSDVWAEAVQITGDDAQHDWQVTIRWSPTTKAVKPAKELKPTHRLVWVDGTITRNLDIMSIIKRDVKTHLFELRCVEVVN